MNTGKNHPFPALVLVVFLLLGVSSPSLFPSGRADPAPAETGAVRTGTAQEDTELRLPRWVRDLRRGEIVAFGSFPFTFFVATFAMDTYRTSQHNWDQRYAPWPLKSAGAINMTKEETGIVIGAAAGGAILVALADFFIVLAKRNREEKAAAALPAGEPIIVRKPWPEAVPEAPPPLSPEGEGREEGETQAEPAGAEAP
ncbi:MAG: hypothetical protein LBQ38_06870 [Spirochaetaceae bacterium]|jgi:hypothetical protein|nr:hypothetical protein [Spirochaetaceae bacterium]